MKASALRGTWDFEIFFSSSSFFFSSSVKYRVYFHLFLKSVKAPLKIPFLET